MYDEDVQLFNAWFSMYGESRAGLLDAPLWCFQVAQLHDSARNDKMIRDSDKRKQADMFNARFGG